MLQINIFGFTKKRFPFTQFAMNEICNISPENKEKIMLHLYCHKDDKDMWYKEATQEKYQDLDVAIHLMDNADYVHKVPIAHQTTAEFSCKLDEDCFMSRYLWDYAIENLGLLNADPRVSVIVPLLSNGIPSVDLFLLDFLLLEEREPAYEMWHRDGLKSTLDVWGCNYRKLQAFIESMPKWDAEAYWKFMDAYNPIEGRPWLPSNLQWAKGLHPCRFSDPYHYFILEKTMKYKDKILQKQNYYLEARDTAYLCNSIFFAKTSFWKESFALLYDGYDEGQMTILAKMKGMRPVYIRNGFGIHMAYGGVPHQQEIEDLYIKQLCST